MNRLIYIICLTFSTIFICKAQDFCSEYSVISDNSKTGFKDVKGDLVEEKDSRSTYKSTIGITGAVSTVIIEEKLARYLYSVISEHNSSKAAEKALEVFATNMSDCLVSGNVVMRTLDGKQVYREVILWVEDDYQIPNTIFYSLRSGDKFLVVLEAHAMDNAIYKPIVGAPIASTFGDNLAKVLTTRVNNYASLKGREKTSATAETLAVFEPSIILPGAECSITDKEYTAVFQGTGDKAALDELYNKLYQDISASLGEPCLYLRFDDHDLFTMLDFLGVGRKGSLLTLHKFPNNNTIHLRIPNLNFTEATE
jgi:hypothetical protein